MKWTLHNSRVTNPTYWRSGITFFSLMKKEKITSDELEQGSYSELPHKFVSRESYAVLTSYNIPEMRAKKQQKVGISYFTAHRHKNCTMINPNYLYFFFSYFLSHTNILKVYLNIPKWYVTLWLGLLEKVILVFPKTLEIFHIHIIPNFLLLKIRNWADSDKNKIKYLQEITDFKSDFLQSTAWSNSEKDKHIMLNFWVSALQWQENILISRKSTLEKNNKKENLRMAGIETISKAMASSSLLSSAFSLLLSRSLIQQK